MSIAKKALSGAIWMSSMNYIGYAFNFVIQLIIVRLLFPEDFGIVALGLSIAEILLSFFGFSFSMAVIQIPDEEGLCDTAFYLTLFSGLTSIIIGFIISICIFNRYPLNSVIIFMILCAIQPLQGCAYIHSAVLEKKLQFKQTSIVRGLSTNLSGIFALILASLGIGVWSLLWKEVLSSTIYYFGMSRVSNYKFKWKFNKNAAKKIFTYAYKRAIVRGLEILFFRSHLFLIGSLWGSRILGLFSQSFYLSNLPNTMLSAVTHNVAFATYSKVNDDNDKLGKSFYLTNFFIIRLILPISLLILLFPSDILRILYGQKWLDASSFFMNFSLFILLLPVFMNIIILTMSTNHMNISTSIYCCCSILLYLGIFILFYCSQLSLISLLFSISIFFGFCIGLYFIQKIGIRIDFIKLFFLPVSTLFGILVLKNISEILKIHYLTTVTINYLAIMIYIIVFIIEWKEINLNYVYLKSKLYSNC